MRKQFLLSPLAAVMIAAVSTTDAHATDWLQFGYDTRCRFPG